MKLKVFVAPGVAEGKWHINRLSKALQKHNFDMTTVVTDADIIIAHSGGLHVAPKYARTLIHKSKPKLMVWIGLPYWPGKLPLLSMIQLPIKDLLASIKNQTVRLLVQKTFWNIVYYIREPLYGWRVASSMRKTPPHELLSAPHNLVIRNHDDVWCTPQIKYFVGNAEVVDLPGVHDDCWYRPDVYVKLILNYINKHAQYGES